MNINFVDGQIDTSKLPLAPGSGTEYRPEYVNFPLITSDSSTGMNLGKEPERKIGNGTAVAPSNLQRRSMTVFEEADAPPPIPVKNKRSDSQVPASHSSRHRDELPPRRVMECEQCSDLKQWLSLWELGVSGLTRQYSQVLAQLNHARDAATIIECKMRESWETGVGVAEGVGVAKRTEEREREREGSLRAESVEVKVTRRRTMLDAIEESQENSLTQSQVKASTLADQMYPQRNRDATAGGVGGEAPASFPTDYAPHLAELSSRLEKAIDLCQQLAVASFKTNSSGVLKKKNVGRKTSTPLSLTPDITRRGEREKPSPWRPFVRVDRVGAKDGGTSVKRGVLTRMETEPVLKFGSDICEEVIEKEGEREEREKREKAKKKTKNSPSKTRKTGLSRSKSRYVPKKDRPTRSSVAGDLFDGRKLEAQPVRSHMMSLIAADDARERAGQVGGEGAGPAVVVGSSESEESGELMMSAGSTFSDTDVKQVMTKIAVLEDERLKLLEIVDQMQNNNQRVRLSLQETVGDLENKDLQLTLAMQDLTIATDEIRKVAGLRSQLDIMERDRQLTLEKLSSLEDESAAVKVSLIQLLQEKSATNKTLALENWRLRQAVRQGEGLSRTNSRSSTTNEPTLDIMKDDDLSNYVHKQGFLVKQGRRVKNWKRRLFVLDSTGLSYYKTEQPIQRVCLSDITKIQVSHNHTFLPHLFEVHTSERTFLLSAPSEDEMQSWIGMLQTLKQYARNPSPPAPQDRGGNPAPTTPNGISGSANAVLHQLLVDNGSAVGRGKERRSTTFPTTTGISVRKEEEEVGGASTRGDSPTALKRGAEPQRRPRSQAITMTTELSLDEAVPSSARPHSVVASSALRHGELEWENGVEVIAEEEPSTDSTTCKRVLSQSHPGTGASQLTTVPVIPAIVLET